MRGQLPFYAACMLSGILIYFAELWLVLCLMISGFLVFGKTTRCAAIFLLLGIGSAFMRENMMDHEILQQKLWNRQIQGKIVSSKMVERGTKLIIDHVSIDGVPLFSTKADTARIDLMLYGQNIFYKSGSIISCKAHLFPMHTRSFSYAFDCMFYSYYNLIVAKGMIKGAVQIIEATEDNKMSLRERIYAKLCRNLSGERLYIALALITGHRDMINVEMREKFARAGISHLLAISGLHMCLLGGLVMFLIRTGCALFFPMVCAYLDVKKMSLCASVIILYVYLQISGCAVPAIRAFVMYVFMLLGALHDREGISERSLAIAAICVMLIYPESVLSASFQMSFAAVGGIVAYYRSKRWRGGKIADMLCVALIASVVTAPFSIYHFRYFSLNGVIANVILIPLMTVILMPMLVLSVPMLFINEHLFSRVIGLCSDRILWWVELFAQWPFAFDIPVMTKPAFVLIGYAVICLCIGSQWRKWCKYCCALGVLLYILSPRPDVLLTRDVCAVYQADATEKIYMSYRLNGNLSSSKQKKESDCDGWYRGRRFVNEWDAYWCGKKKSQLHRKHYVELSQQSVQQLSHMYANLPVTCDDDIGKDIYEGYTRYGIIIKHDFENHKNRSGKPRIMLPTLILSAVL